MHPILPTSTSATAINALGIDLLQAANQPESNVLWSPYSIQSALAMAYAGAAGSTREELARVLHYPDAEEEVHRSFAALRTALAAVVERSVEAAQEFESWGARRDPIALLTANRLFGQAGYEVRESFLALTRDRYGAPFESIDFVQKAADARRRINLWVEDQTRQRIRDLIPENTLGPLTRLVLVNALYLKAPWAEEFDVSATQPRPFHIAGGDPQEVPTMTCERQLGHARREGFCVVAIPYSGWDLRLLVFLPDEVDGLAKLETGLTASLLAQCADLPTQEVVLYLPRFKLEPPTIPLSATLQALGMKTAFDQPRGSADFDRVAPRLRDDYLYISEVFHKTFLQLDEKGTEAAAATALLAPAGCMPGEEPKPIEVRVDHPFLFAIQHRPSGACLFLGHVADPR